MVAPPPHRHAQEPGPYGPLQPTHGPYYKYRDSTCTPKGPASQHARTCISTCINHLRYALIIPATASLRTCINGSRYARVLPLPAWSARATALACAWYADPGPWLGRPCRPSAASPRMAGKACAWGAQVEDGRQVGCRAGLSDRN